MNDGASTLRLAAVAAHLLSLMLWIGSLVSITRVLAATEGEGDLVRAKLAAAARKIYRVVASPWMGIAVLTGVFLVATVPQSWQARDAGLSGLAWLFKQGWWHAKLLGVVAMLALHFALGARVKRAERDAAPAGTASAVRGVQIGVLVVAALVVSCVLVWKRARVPACPPASSTTALAR